MRFWKIVAAYITGWLIVQPLYNRLLHHWRRGELDSPSRDTRDYWRWQAEMLADVLADRGYSLTARVRPVLYDQEEGMRTKGQR